MREWQEKQSLMLPIAALLAMSFTIRPAEAGSGNDVQFVRDIQPILADNCFACHGPDAKARMAELRFDQKKSVFEKGTRSAPVIVPGKPELSDAFKRITSTDLSEKMPPHSTGKQLTPLQISKIKAWIEMGAPWQEHWAFVAPVRPPVPQISSGLNPIDAFVRARLNQEKWKPAAEADRVSLIRRLSLDLLGLPPSPKEIDAFLADNSPDAYGRLVDRWLASPHYGEKMAQHWLDVARYADTNGYHIDNHRDMWKWRDWVINAFNSNKRFDAFTIEQLAGDMLPNATVDQRIASGFNRNCMVNFEGGAIAEEYATKYVVDRVVTTSTVFLGLTMGCCECHDHKYDPLSQKEFYQFYAFFNNVPEKGLDGQRTNPVPSLVVPSEQQKKELSHFDARIAALKQTFHGPNRELEERQRQWEKLVQSTPTPDWALVDAVSAVATGGTKLTVQKDGSYLASGENPNKDTYTIRFRTDLAKLTAIRLDAFPDPSLPTKGPGRAHNGNFVLTRVKVTADREPLSKDSGNKSDKSVTGASVANAAPSKNPKAAKSKFEPVVAKKKSNGLPFAAVSASHSQVGFEVANSLEGKKQTGWAILPHAGKHQSAVYELEAPLDCTKETVITVTLEFHSQFVQHGLGRFRITACDDPMPHERNSLAAPVAQALATPIAKRSPAQRDTLREYYRASYWHEGRQILAQIKKEEKGRELYASALPATMVMQEMKPGRMTNILVRGDYRNRGLAVRANVPAVLPPLPANSEHDRLALGKWMMDPRNPLVARVAVNRYWQQFFGIGLVKTSNDFGTRGELPSHPELLDWLATEYMQSGWDTKRLIRLIVTSATYKQSSLIAKEMHERDPENRLLERGPRFRLDAEEIRDNALVISGLFAPAIGGPSVRPYQPPGIWEEMAFGNEFSSQRYEMSAGQDVYRRGLYTYWKRSMPYPSFITFDAPNRELCTVQRPRTNTPLQALVLLNDPVYLEAARALGQRMMREGGGDALSKIRYGFRLATSRLPNDSEAAVLANLYQRKWEDFRKDQTSALALLKSAGLKVSDNSAEANSAAETAAWTIVGNALLNLSETITKG